MDLDKNNCEHSSFEEEDKDFRSGHRKSETQFCGVRRRCYRQTDHTSLEVYT